MNGGYIIKKKNCVKEIVLSDLSLKEKINHLKELLKVNDEENVKLIKKLIGLTNSLVCEYSQTLNEKVFLEINSILDIISHFYSFYNFNKEEIAEFYYKECVVVMNALVCVRDHVLTDVEKNFLSIVDKINKLSLRNKINHTKFNCQIEKLYEELEKKRNKVREQQNKPSFGKTREKLFYSNLKSFIDSINKGKKDAYHYLFILKHMDIPNNIDSELIESVNSLTHKNEQERIMIEEIKSILNGKIKNLSIADTLLKFNIDGKEIKPSIVTPSIIVKDFDSFYKTFSLTIDSSLNLATKDDALSIRKDGTNYIIGIHLTNIPAVVIKNSPLDSEARKRNKTIYLPDKVIRIFPETFTKNHLSLEEDCIRECLSLHLVISTSGEIKDISIKNDRIKVDTNLSYSEADEILTGKRKSETQYYLKTLYDASTILSSLSNAKNEYFKIKDREKEEFEELDPELNLLSHNIIKEFMILYNKYFAIFSNNKCIPIIYRVHEKFNPEDYRIPFVDEKLNVIMGVYPKAHYSMTNTGHYGTKEAYYTHASAGLRRYVDAHNQYVYEKFTNPFTTDEEKEAIIKQTKKILEYSNEQERKIKTFEAEYYSSYVRSLKLK